METGKRKLIRIVVVCTVIIALAIWCNSRWEAWFHNPAEAPYTAPSEPSRLLLTFGNEGELSRYVSWMCDSIIDPDAHLLLADTASADTISVPAIGEVFRSRSGVAAYYRAHITQLLPDRTYSYSVITNARQSAWHEFHTSDPTNDTFSFLFFGDVQDTISGITNTLIRRALSAHPEAEFIAFGGDLTERPTDAYWAETFRSIDSACTRMPVINVTGNHDYLKYLIRKCERRFALIFPYFLQGMDERNDNNHLFSLRYHNTELDLLDTDRGAFFLNQQRRWLASHLAESTAPNRIVIGHHPLFSVKKKNNNLIQRHMFNGTIMQSGVKLVLQGHEHAYTRCTASESPLQGNVCNTAPLYTISHCSPKTYKVRPTERFSPVLTGSRYYQLITVNADTITMRAFDANNGLPVDSVLIY